MTHAIPDSSPYAALAAFMAKHDLTVSAVFVPFSQSRNAKPRGGADKPWRSLNWRVTLTKAGRPIIDTDYSAGEGHAPSAKAVLASAPFTERRAQLIAWEIEHGYPARFYSSTGDIARDFFAKPILPNSVDVFASLVSDSDVLDVGGFDAWASDYGYDPDSRSAESIYRACLEIALKLRAALGDSALTEARDLAREL